MTDSGLPGDNAQGLDGDAKSARESDNILEKVGDAVGSKTGAAPEDPSQKDDDED